jgi:hypothetical protein
MPRRSAPERDGYQHARLASQHLFEPRTLWRAAFARLLHDGAAADDEESPKRTFAHLGCRAKFLLAARRSLKRRQTEPGREVTAFKMAGGARAAIAVAEIGPMPETLISRRDTSSSRARSAISLSRSAILPLRSASKSNISEHGVGRADDLFFLDQQASPHATALWVQPNHIQ